MAMRWLGTLRTLIPGSAFQGAQAGNRALQMQLASGARAEIRPAERYAMLRWYYQNNALYDRLNAAFFQQGRVAPAAKGLRNPAYRIVEFYPATLWPGDLPDALPLQFPAAMPAKRQEALTSAIHQVWAWSNWAPAKQTFARWLPMLGDVFLKVVQPAGTGRVYFELIDPAYVTDFDADARGYLTYCRIDIPREERAGQTLTRYTHVEVWDKAAQTYQRWQLPEHPSAGITAEVMGPADETIPFSQFGIDFIPIVHAKFMDVGELRGVGAFLLQLDKIDNLNMEATRLAQLLYRHNRKTLVVSANDKDAAGRPGAAPVLPDVEVTEDDEVWTLPGLAKVDSLIPAINFEAHRLWIADDIRDLQGDCPELAYWHFTEEGVGRDLSGRAIKYMLGPAINRLLEVRGRAEDALARADAMALTLGQAAGLPGFQGLGSYDAGDFEHTFQAREVVPLSDAEEATTSLQQWQTAVLQASLGVSHQQILRERNYTEDQIKQMQDESATTGIVPGINQ
jgi:hypothetical protein